MSKAIFTVKNHGFWARLKRNCCFYFSRTLVFDRVESDIDYPKSCFFERVCSDIAVFTSPEPFYRVESDIDYPESRFLSASEAELLFLLLQNLNFWPRRNRYLLSRIMVFDRVWGEIVVFTSPEPWFLTASIAILLSRIMVFERVWGDIAVFTFPEPWFLTASRATLIIQNQGFWARLRRNCYFYFSRTLIFDRAEIDI